MIGFMKFLYFLSVLCFAIPVIAQESLPKGLVKEKPSEGFFVETDQGIMVP